MVLSRPDGARAYVACYGEDVVAVVDLDKREVLDRIPVDASGASIGDPKYGPYSAVLSPDGKTLALGNTVSKDVRFFDVEANAMDPDRQIDTLGAPFFPAFSVAKDGPASSEHISKAAAVASNFMADVLPVWGGQLVRPAA